jgi:flagellar protein FliJ
MSRFKFRLAPLLRLREMTRDERRLALAEAYRVDDLLRERLLRLDQEGQWLREFCRQAAGPGIVDVDRLVETQRYELALRSQRVQIVQQRAKVAEEIARRQNGLLEADREVKTLEKLREKKIEQHRFDELQRDQKRLDEVAQQLAMREVSL